MAGLDDEVRTLVAELLRRWGEAVPPAEREGAAGVYLRREQDEYRRRATDLAGSISILRANYDELCTTPGVVAALRAEDEAGLGAMDGVPV